jgi:N-acyl homoserine lactone hydrolase
LHQEQIMTVDYDIVVPGNSVRLPEGFIGLANLTLVHAGSGPMMVDVGHVANRQGLVDGLARHGLKPADVPRLFLTHLHNDHVMNIDLFPFETTVYVGRTEWEYAANPHENDAFIPWMVREQLEKYDLQLLDAEGELEPGLRYLSVPGHTPGCMALDLDTESKGRVIISGDAIKYPKEMLRRAIDGCFDTQENAKASIDRIMAMADRIVPGHYSELIREGAVFVWEEPATLNLIFR